MIKVYIWRTQITFNQRFRSSSSSSVGVGQLGLDYGHVGLEIPDNNNVYCPKHYMSYWPPNKKPEKYSYYYPEDKENCGEADCIVNVYNLDEDRMVKTWKEELVKDFNDFDHNCCTVAAEILRHGFDGYLDKSAWNKIKSSARMLVHPFATFLAAGRNTYADAIIWSPSKIENFAKFLQKLTR